MPITVTFIKKYDMTVYAATTTTTHSRHMTTILARQSLAFGRISPAMQVLADPRVQRLCSKYVSTRNCGLLCIFLLFGGKQHISSGLASFEPLSVLSSISFQGDISKNQGDVASLSLPFFPFSSLPPFPHTLPFLVPFFPVLSVSPSVF